ncbi:MAG: hypothetical protein ACLQFR_15080 [Streptosporangiaceae bacterium]
MVQATAVWAAISLDSGRPVPLSEAFLRVYGGAAGDRTVSARLSHDRWANGTGDGSRGWPLRAADFDTAGHVNNAIHWAAVEDVLAPARWLPSMAEMEYHRAILPGCTPSLVVNERATDTQVWLLDGERLLASALLMRKLLPGQVKSRTGLTGPTSRHPPARPARGRVPPSPR